MQQSIRFGVMGFAGIARRAVIPALEQAANARPYALASRKEESRLAAKRDFSFEKIYDDYEGLLGDKDVDAVYIPLPNGLHREWTIKAARAGKHVLCEKPLGLSRGEVQEMRAACRDNGVKLMEGFMYRFTTRTQKLRELLAQKVVGEVLHINSTFRFVISGENNVRLNPLIGGGALWDVGCYPVNLIGMIMGEAPESFTAKKVERHGVDISLSAVLKYRSGALCTVSCGFNSNSAQFTEINGTKGTLLIRDTFDQTDAPIILVKDGIVTEIPVPACQRYVLMVEDFSSSILDNREPGFSLDETERNVGLIERILKSVT
jgi:xylose dehydrogenase (NAD/NADP)